MRFSRLVKDTLRPARDFFFLIGGVLYDAWRFLIHSGIWFKRGAAKRDYKAVKIYHRMEKSLGFRNRKPTSGWDAACDFVHHLEKNKALKDGFLFHELVGLKVLGDFTLNSTAVSNEHVRVVEYLKQNAGFSESQNQGGVTQIRVQDVQLGRLENPEQFFMSRYSVRDFKNKSVDNEIIYRALSLAAKTPSVCNRQAWHVYHLDTRSQIDLALSLQNGNKGFGHEVPCLLLITADLSAFDTANERYQHWIDGGMYAMSVVFSLHSLGLASCCLNWDQGPINDMRLRTLLPLKDHHTVIMMIAVGYPNDEIKVCYSARKPLNDYYEYLGESK